ncbi:DUF962 domain-containing protein [Paraferrimonas sp. SM1919]|uniref:Mpo1 family 2-hydroxy fatty acid dioxygenase n=1 Tax=Paraferrimonas sp. SM1919 TaxID=2662263 RepID=UPI0013D14D86|nr:Mpo1-like protein [Paraferrimonas sp. SM1919]
MSKSIQQWFDEYGVSHQNPTNKVIHFWCVPIITVTLLAMIWVLSPWLTMAFIAIISVFYARLSLTLMTAMLLLLLPTIYIFNMLHAETLLYGSIVVFILAWIGQFIGHNIEGKKPSFFEDLQFLLIGPLWILGHLFRKFKIDY